MATYWYTIFQKKRNMDSSILPGAQGQGHVTLSHVEYAPWS